MLSPDQITHSANQRLQALRPVIDESTITDVTREGWQQHGSTVEHPFDHHVEHEGAAIARFDPFARPMEGWLEVSPLARERFSQLVQLAGPIGYAGVSSKFTSEVISNEAAARNKAITDIEQRYGRVSLGIRRGGELLLARLLLYVPNEGDSDPTSFKSATDALPMTADGIYVPLQNWPRASVDKEK